MTAPGPLVGAWPSSSVLRTAVACCPETIEEQLRVQLLDDEARTRLLIERLSWHRQRVEHHPRAPLIPVVRVAQLPTPAVSISLHPSRTTSPSSSTFRNDTIGAALNERALNGPEAVATKIDPQSDAVDEAIAVARRNRCEASKRRSAPFATQFVRKRGDGLLDSGRWGELQQVEEEERVDIELVEDVSWRDIAAAAPASAVALYISFGAKERYHRELLIQREHERFLSLMHHFGMLNAQLQLALLRAVIFMTDGDAGAAHCRDECALIDPVRQVALSYSDTALMKGLELSEQRARSLIVNTSRVEYCEIYDDFTILRPVECHSVKSPHSPQAGAAHGPRRPLRAPFYSSSSMSRAGVVHHRDTTKAAIHCARRSLAERRVVCRIESLERAATCALEKQKWSDLVAIAKETLRRVHLRNAGHDLRISIPVH